MSISELSAQDVYAELHTRREGLTDAEVKTRRSEFGPNVLAQVKKRPIIYRFFEQFTHAFALMLIAASILVFIAYLLDPNPDTLYLTIAIMGVVVLNAVIGFFQEYRAEKATEALQKLVPAFANVMRQNRRIKIPAEDLVLGDVVFLEEGDNISADGRLVEEFELRTMNVALTGESDPVNKTSDPVLDMDLSKTEIPNLVFMGTSVAAGNGVAVVTDTGMNTEFGKIFRLTTTVEDPPSPLQIQIAVMAKRIAVVATALGLMLFGASQVMNMGLVAGFILGMSVMVALMPEGLPATMSVALSVGVQRMVRENALIKRLSSVETLGSTTVICTDKTGTLTKAEMTARRIWFDGKQIELTGVGYEPRGDFRVKDAVLPPQEVTELFPLLRCAAFCNNSRLLPPEDDDKSWSVLGDPTEGALLVAAAKAHFDLQAELIDEPLLYQLPFDSTRKRMTSIHSAPRGTIAYVKGAPREVLGLCTHVLKEHRPVPLSVADRDAILAANDRFASESLRVLAMAERSLPAKMGDYTIDSVETDLIFLGLVGMMDPPRPEVSDAVKHAHTAGIRTIMITGDYGLTAEAVARKIGMVTTSSPRIITGFDLEQMDDDALTRELADNHEVVFARVAPDHKMRVAQTLRKMGEVVAMTGDGVNDAPALKTADIGVAMGIAGTDVSKEAAVMILLDDSFASIVKAVEEGRAVYADIKKFILYLFSHNLGELLPYLFVTAAQINLVPLTALQILAIDLGSDVMPALALGTEPAEPGVMEQPPRSQKARLMDTAMVKRLLLLGIIQGSGATFAFMYALLSSGWRWGDPVRSLPGTPVYARAITMTMGAVVVSQFANGFGCRTSENSLFSVGLFSNRNLVLSEAFGVTIMAAISYVPFLQDIFKTGPLRAMDWLILVAFAAILFAADEIRKLFARRGGAAQDKGQTAGGVPRQTGQEPA